MLSPRQDESGILIPLVLVETLWWCQAFQHDYFTYFPDRYKLSITMVWPSSWLQVLILWSVEIFGAMVAGMTSEGGGAVAFPVKPLTLPLAFNFPFLPPFTFNFLPCPSLTTSLFHLCPHLTSVFDLHEGHIPAQVSHNALLQVMTLALGIAPTVARDFSVMIQSIGEHHKRDIKSKCKSSTEGERVFMNHDFIRDVCGLVHYSLDEGEVMSSTSCMVSRPTKCVSRLSDIELKTPQNLNHDFFGKRSNWRSTRWCSVALGPS